MITTEPLSPYPRPLFHKQARNGILAFTNDCVKEISGNYDAFLASQQQESATQEKPQKKVSLYRQRKEEESLRRKRQTRLKNIEAELSEISKAVEEINAHLQTQEVASDYEKVTELTIQLSEYAEKEETLLSEFLELEEILNA